MDTPLTPAELERLAALPAGSHDEATLTELVRALAREVLLLRYPHPALDISPNGPAVCLRCGHGADTVQALLRTHCPAAWITHPEPGVCPEHSAR